MSEQTEKGIIRYRENPSIEKVDQQTRTKLKKVKVRGNDGKSEWHNGELGEVIQGAVLFQEEEVDVSKFVKLYTGGVAAISGLTKAGAKVFEIIMSEIGASEDAIFINTKQICEDYDISYATVQRGLKSLRDQQVLFDHYNGYGWFFINVAYVFKGDRYTLIKQYRIKSSNQEEVEYENPNQPQLPFDGEINT